MVVMGTFIAGSVPQNGIIPARGFYYEEGNRAGRQIQNSRLTVEAEIYIKGKTEILKQNILMRFAHHLFPVDRKNKDMIFEMVSHSKFNAPNNYLHSFEAINGNSIPTAQNSRKS